MDQGIREAEVRTVFGDPATDPVRARLEDMSRRAGIVLSDPDTAAALARLPSDEAIPDRVFDVAAALLAYLAAVEEGAPPSLSR